MRTKLYSIFLSPGKSVTTKYEKKKINKIISLKRAEYLEGICLSAMNTSSEEFMVDQSQFLASAEVEGYFRLCVLSKPTSVRHFVQPAPGPV